MGSKLLLVEDDSGIAEMLKAALGRWGYETLHARDSASADRIARAEGDAIGVALCDVALPDGSGMEVAEMLRRRCPGVWIIFTSGYPMDVLTDRGLIDARTLGGGATSYLPKPFLPSDVRDLIGRALLRKVEAKPRRCYAAAAAY